MTDVARSGPTMGRTDTLLCRVHECICALPLEHVVEVMRPLPVDRVTGAPAFVAGLSRIRGTAVPVVDLGRLVTGTDGRASARFVTVRSGAGVVALRVDSVVGVTSLSESAELPPLFRDEEGPIAALGDRDRALLLVLRTARLVPPEPAPVLAGGAA